MGFTKGQAQGRLTSSDDDIVPLVDHLMERFSTKKVQLKMFSPPLKSSFPPAEITSNETRPVSVHFVISILFKLKKKDSSWPSKEIQNRFKIMVKSAYQHITTISYLILLLSQCQTVIK